MSGKLTKFLRSSDSGQLLLPLVRRFLFDTAMDAYHGTSSRHDLDKLLLQFKAEQLTDVCKQYGGSARLHTGGKFHPSSLSGCPRALWFDVMEAPRNPPISADDCLKEHLIFSMGDAVHLRWQSLCHVAGILVQAEMPIEIPAYDIIGHCDGVVKINGKKYVLEIKSANSNSFAGTREPKKNHVMQASLYMEAVGLTDAIMLYENKDRHEVKEFHIKKDEQMIRDAYAVITGVRKFIKLGKPPQKCAASPRDEACHWCRFTSVCHNQVKLEQFLKGMKHESQTAPKAAHRSLRIRRSQTSGKEPEGTGSGSALRRFVSRG